MLIFYFLSKKDYLLVFSFLKFFIRLLIVFICLRNGFSLVSGSVDGLLYFVCFGFGCVLINSFVRFIVILVCVSLVIWVWWLLEVVLNGLWYCSVWVMLKIIGELLDIFFIMLKFSILIIRLL